MSEPFVAEIRMFAGNFAPRGFAFCDGQILAIAQNTALFALLGTTYGGNGTTNFALPDLRDRFPMHEGSGPGLTPRDLGEQGGVAAVSLTPAEIPAHTHDAAAVQGSATAQTPTNLYPAATTTPVYGPPSDLVPLAPASVAPAGAGLPHENRQPYLAVSFIIALQGIFPARN